MIVIYAPTAQLSAETLEFEVPPAMTIGSEFGAYVCEGQKYTSHLFQDMEDKVFPCFDESMPVLEENDVVLISSFCIGTFGGLLKASGDTEVLGFKSFWEAVETSYRKGAHKLLLDDSHRVYLGYRSLLLDLMQDFSRHEREDMTGLFNQIKGVLLEALKEKKGEIWDRGAFEEKRQVELNSSSFVMMTKLGVLVRRSPHTRTEHLLADPDGNEGIACISFTEFSGRIYLSFADEIKGLTCGEIASELWGDSAHGTSMWGVSPSEVVLGEGDFYRAVDYFSDRIVGQIYG